MYFFPGLKTNKQKTGQKRLNAYLNLCNSLQSVKSVIFRIETSIWKLRIQRGAVWDISDLTRLQNLTSRKWADSQILVWEECF